MSSFHSVKKIETISIYLVKLDDSWWRVEVVERENKDSYIKDVEHKGKRSSKSPNTIFLTADMEVLKRIQQRLYFINWGENEF
jgi:hypothetical protein